MEGNRVIKRKLIQVVFFHKEAIRFGQRIMAGKVLVVDGACNMNKLRMPLSAEVGITNSNETFPSAYSYCLGETAGPYDFLEILGEEVFLDDTLDPAVIMGDQTPGLIKAVDVLDSIPNDVLQFRNWHAVEATRAKFDKAGFTTEEIDGYTEGQAPNEAEIPRFNRLTLGPIPERHAGRAGNESCSDGSCSTAKREELHHRYPVSKEKEGGILLHQALEQPGLRGYAAE
jgi:hypothetical protein